MDCNKHTKMVEVPQERVWKYSDGLWAFVREDGYDALAYIHADHHRGVFHWWTREQRSGFSPSMNDAKRDGARGDGGTMTDAELLAEAVARAAACGKTEGGEAEGWKESLDRVLQRLRAAERDVAVLKKNDQDARDMRYSTTIERDLEMQKVVDGIKARAAVNEAIVRDLAAAKVVQGIYNGGHDVETCALCGETGEYEDDVNLIGLRLDHKSTCPYRRAVETTKP